jgi:glyoxylate reductase
MNSPRIAVTRGGLPGGAVARLASAGDVVEWPGDRPPGADELRAFAAGADALLCMGGDRIDGALLAAAPRLRVVALASAGYDALDVDRVRAAGVIATHTPGVLHETTADLAFALILMARRRLGAASGELRAGRWQTQRMDGFLGLDVCGATLGILGYGEIGKAVGRRAHGFGMRVQHHGGRADELSRPVELGELLRTSDVVSVHVPLTDRTRGLIGVAELALMKPTATLVNTARGGIVDETALAAALRAGRLHSAGLDVFVGEPRSDPADPLFAAPNLVVLPHVGSATEATRARMVDLAAANIEAVLAGRPPLTPVGSSAPTARAPRS